MLSKQDAPQLVILGLNPREAKKHRRKSPRLASPAADLKLASQRAPSPILAE